ncbi:hypothetical protein M436DRAFT_63612 [Aureobasidium namibiae CBS 147.97]|uniref:C2H2-type domain-containing protein n=1 Tax=Aureobasidium namibiae CBS 147.97 TaxID=1043004 RepID=A0A074XFB1_9PEZI
MNREQRQSLINDLWDRDDLHVMIVRYNDEAQRIGTQGTTTTFHANPMQAIDAFFSLLGNREYQRHPALNDNMYQWLVAHTDGLAEPTANDLVGNVMSDLTEDNTAIHSSNIIALEIIPLLEYHNRDHGMLAGRPDRTIDPRLLPRSEYTLGLDDPPPTPNPEPLIDLDEDIVMFDHWIPPPEFIPPFVDDGSEVPPFERELFSPSPPDPPLFANPTPGPVPLPAANNTPAPSPNAPAQNTRNHPRRRVADPNVDARRIHACAFVGCSSRFTRPSDLARHWRTVHTGHTQQ